MPWTWLVAAAPKAPIVTQAAIATTRIAAGIFNSYPGIGDLAAAYTQIGCAGCV
jgi:hypothetical protein